MLPLADQKPHDTMIGHIVFVPEHFHELPLCRGAARHHSWSTSLKLEGVALPGRHIQKAPGFQVVSIAFEMSVAEQDHGETNGVRRPTEVARKRSEPDARVDLIQRRTTGGAHRIVG